MGTKIVLDPADRARIAAQRERVEREEREWRAARLHHFLHGNWLSADECPVCRVEGKP